MTDTNSDNAAAARTRGEASFRAQASLVLGLISFGFGLGFLSGIPAWIMGRNELAAIKAGLAPEGGRGLARAGLWLGGISTVLSGLALFGLFLMLMAGSR